MGYGDNEPPAMRADAFPATLRGPSGFRILVLTFVDWDVIKFTASAVGEPNRHMEIESGTKSTDFVFQPTKSGVIYTLTSQGCAKAFDGSTGYCSPPSKPLRIFAAVNTHSLRQFLLLNGIGLHNETRLRAYVNTPSISLRALMGL